MAFPVDPASDSFHSTPASTVQVVGGAPAVATASLMLATSQALALAAHGATRDLEAGFLQSRAVTACCVRLLLGEAERAREPLAPIEVFR